VFPRVNQSQAPIRGLYLVYAGKHMSLNQDGNYYFIYLVTEAAFSDWLQLTALSLETKPCGA